MKFQFGDSTESPFETDYLQFLDTAVECFVAALHAHAKVCDTERRRDQLRTQAARDVELIDEVAGHFRERLDSIKGGPVGSCASAIARAAGSIVKAELARAEDALQVDLGVASFKIDVATREGLASLERLLQTHDLPNATIQTFFSLQSQRYRALQYADTAYGVGYLLDIDLPLKGTFGEPTTVGSVAKRVVVRLPQRQRFWSIVGRRQILDRMIVTAAVFTGSSVGVSLRKPGKQSSEGFDILLHRGEKKDVQLREIIQQQAVPLDVDPATRTEIARFTDALEKQAVEVKNGHRKLLEATLDGNAIGVGGATFDSLVARVIESIAGDVAEIAKHSPNADEYVLRAQVDRYRHEERQLPVSRLNDRVSSLPAPLRDLFGPILFPLGCVRRRLSRGSSRPNSADKENCARGSEERRAKHGRIGMDPAGDGSTQSDRLYEQIIVRVQQAGDSTPGPLSAVRGEIEQGSVVLPIGKSSECPDRS